jgi:hypothetical protein
MEIYAKKTHLGMHRLSLNTKLHQHNSTQKKSLKGERIFFLLSNERFIDKETLAGCNVNVAVSKKLLLRGEKFVIPRCVGARCCLLEKLILFPYT